MTDLYRVLTSNPSNIFGIKWNRNWKSGLHIQSMPDLRNVPLDIWAKIPKDTLQKFCGKPPQNSGSYHSCNRGTNSLMPMDLEWGAIKVPVSVIARCPNTFVPHKRPALNLVL